MKKIFLIVISLFFFNQIIAQKQAIKITNSNTNKEKIIKENKRIKLTTVDGKKISGRFKIENDKIIFIDNISLNLSDIYAIKRNPLLVSIFTSSFLIYGGALTAGLGVLIGVLADSAAFWLTIPAAGMIYTGVKSPNFNKNHKKDKGWKFEIITLSN